MIAITMAHLNVHDREVFIEQLSQAGWDVESWDVARDPDVNIDLAAEAEYAGPSLVLRLELPHHNAHLILQVCELDGEPLFRLRLYPMSGLAAILANIIAVQNSLDRENHSSLVKSLIRISDVVQIETDEGIFKLS